MFDAMDLSGTNGEPDLRGICSLAAARKFEFMRDPFVQQGSNDEQEIEKAPFLVVQKIRDAILDETFKPGELAGGPTRENVQCQPVTCPRSVTCD